MSAGAVVLAWRPVDPQSLDDPRDWTALAACQYTDPELFFPAGAEWKTAKRVCRGCEVRAECLAYALANDVEFGVWGGTTERERQRIRARRAREERGLAA